MINFIIKTEDFALAEEKINTIVRTMDNPDIISYNLNEDSLYRLIDELTTISLFDNPKLVILKGANAILDESDEKIKELTYAMADSANSNVLILIDSDFDTKSEERFRRYTLLKKYSQEYDLRITGIKMDEYAKKSFNDDGYYITDDAVNQLCNSSTSLSLLKCNIEILKCYTVEEKNITGDIVDLMIAKPLDENLYDMINAVLKNDKKLIFELYEGFKLKNIKSNTFVPLLLNKFQELYNVYIFARNNAKQNDIATLFGVSPNRAYYLLRDSKSQSLEDIKNNIEYLSKLDYEIKKGIMNDELGLELYFLR